MTISDLGSDILLYEGSDSKVIAELSGTKHRFMDALWLPAPLTLLSSNQISVISRFREQRFLSDTQFEKAGRARSAFIAALTALNESAVLEIGCGKFPLALDLPGTRYLGLDIDHEAIEWCVERGFLVHDLDTAPNESSTKYGTVIASYVFHFDVSDALIDYIYSASAENSVLIFNIVSDGTDTTLSLLGRLGKRWHYAATLKTVAMPRREYWFILASNPGLDRSRLATAALSTFWA